MSECQPPECNSKIWTVECVDEWIDGWIDPTWKRWNANESMFKRHIIGSLFSVNKLSSLLCRMACVTRDLTFHKNNPFWVMRKIFALSLETLDRLWHNYLSCNILEFPTHFLQFYWDLIILGINCVCDIGNTRANRGIKHYCWVTN